MEDINNSENWTGPGDQEESRRFASKVDGGKYQHIQKANGAQGSVQAEKIGKIEQHFYNSTDFNHVQDLIRIRTDNLWMLEREAYNPNSSPYLLSYLSEIQKDILDLKKKANTLVPGTYGDVELSPKIDCYNLPKRTFFTGRKDYIKEILERLDPNDKTWLISIDGIGGVGKTSLANEIAYQCINKRGLDFDKIVWTSAKRSELTSSGIIAKRHSSYFLELNDLLDEICRAFNYNTPVDYSFEDKIRVVKILLKCKRCLLIIDNVETIDNIIKSLVSFLRETPFTTKAILTSRQHFLEVADEGKLIALRGMDQNEAVSLINHVKNEKDVSLTGKQKESLYGLSNGIPLVIKWSIGKMIFSNPDSVLAELKQNCNNDLRKFCFQSSFSTLKGYGEDALKVFFILSLFPFPMSAESLQQVSQIKSDRHFEKVLRTLNLLSLVNIQKKNHVATLPIVREYAKYNLCGEVLHENEVRKRLADFLSAKKNNQQIHIFTQSNEIIALEKEATPVDFAFKIHTALGNKYSLAKVNGDIVSPAYFLNDGDQVVITALPESQGPKLEWARTERARRNIRRNYTRIIIGSDTLVRKGNTLSRDGLLAISRKKYEKALSEDPTHVWGRNRLGQILRLMGEPQKAIGEHLAALSFASDDPFAYSGIASVHYQNGDINESFRYYSKSLRFKNDYINALNGLGRVLCRQKKYIEAEKYFRKAIEASVQIKVKPSCPWLYLNLSISLINQGEVRFKEAEKYLSISLKEFSKKSDSVNSDHIGSHSLYQYSIALMLANSPNYKKFFDKALKHCFYTGVRDEIIGDLKMFNSSVWDSWLKYAVNHTSSKIKLDKSPEYLIAYLQTI